SRRLDLLNTLHLSERLLEGLDDPGLHLVGRRTGPREAHGYVRRVDVRHLTHTDARRGDQTEQDRRGHDHPGEHGPPDADVRQIHGAAREDRRADIAGPGGPDDADPDGPPPRRCWPGSSLAPALALPKGGAFAAPGTPFAFGTLPIRTFAPSVRASTPLVTS